MSQRELRKKRQKSASPEPEERSYRKKGNAFFDKCKPKKDKFVEYNSEDDQEEVLSEGEEDEVSSVEQEKGQTDVKFGFKARNDDEASSDEESVHNFASDVEDQEELPKILNEVSGFVDSDFENIVELIEIRKDSRGRKLVECMNEEGKTKVFLEKALLANEWTKKTYLELTKDNDEKVESPIKDKRESKANRKNAHKSKVSQRKPSRRQTVEDSDSGDFKAQRSKRRPLIELQKKKPEVNTHAHYEKQILTTMYETKGLIGLQEGYSEGEQNEKQIEKEMNELKHETDLNVFSEVGVIDKHFPLEVLQIQGTGKPPFKGDTRNLQVVIRWKFYEKQNYTPTDSEVNYYQFRNWANGKYRRLLIDYLEKQVQLIS